MASSLALKDLIELVEFAQGYSGPLDNLNPLLKERIKSLIPLAQSLPCCKELIDVSDCDNPVRDSMPVIIRIIQSMLRPAKVVTHASFLSSFFPKSTIQKVQAIASGVVQQKFPKPLDVEAVYQCIANKLVIFVLIAERPVACIVSDIQDSRKCEYLLLHTSSSIEPYSLRSSVFTFIAHSLRTLIGSQYCLLVQSDTLDQVLPFDNFIRVPVGTLDYSSMVSTIVESSDHKSLSFEFVNVFGTRGSIKSIVQFEYSSGLVRLLSAQAYISAYVSNFILAKVKLELAKGYSGIVASSKEDPYFISSIPLSSNEGSIFLSMFNHPLKIKKSTMKAPKSMDPSLWPLGMPPPKLLSVDDRYNDYWHEAMITLRLSSAKFKDFIYEQGNTTLTYRDALSYFYKFMRDVYSVPDIVSFIRNEQATFKGSSQELKGVSPEATNQIKLAIENVYKLLKGSFDSIESLERKDESFKKVSVFAKSLWAEFRGFSITKFMGFQLPSFMKKPMASSVKEYIALIRQASTQLSSTRDLLKEVAPDSAAAYNAVDSACRFLDNALVYLEQQFKTPAEQLPKPSSSIVVDSSLINSEVTYRGKRYTIESIEGEAIKLRNVQARSAAKVTKQNFEKYAQLVSSPVREDVSA